MLAQLSAQDNLPALFLIRMDDGVGNSFRDCGFDICDFFQRRIQLGGKSGRADARNRSSILLFTFLSPVKFF